MNIDQFCQYRRRFDRVIEHIDGHLDKDLTLDTLCGLAAFSRFHFQRQFTAFFGISPRGYIQLCRLKRATHMLAFRLETPVTGIALTCGYESPEAFARAFRKRVGQSPSEFRAEPHWGKCDALLQLLNEMRTNPVNSDRQKRRVEIIHFAETNVALLEHRGHPNSIGNTVRKFIEWRKKHRLPPARSATFNILYDDPQQVAAQDYRFAICAATNREVEDNSAGVVAETIPAGRCAVLRHIGSDDGLGDAVRYLYTEWLPLSGEALRDFPIYLQRVKFFPDVPECEAVTDIFLPLR